MTSDSAITMGPVMGVTRLGQAAVIAGAGLLHQVDASTLLVVAGVVLWALATWRKDTREVIRRQNEDLATRNATLEADVLRLTAALAAANDRPNVDKLYEIMDRHDRHSQARDQEIIDGFKDVGASVRANTEAVRLWATQRAPEGF